MRVLIIERSGANAPTLVWSPECLSVYLPIIKNHKHMNVQFEDIETIFTYQLQAILSKTEAEIMEVKDRVKVLSEELEILNQEPSEEDMATIDMAAQFIALANIIKYQVKAELDNRKHELN